MDLRSYFSAAGPSKVAPLASSSSEDESESSEVEESSPPKKLCIAVSKPSRGKSRTQPGKRKYNKKWEEEFTWLEFDEDHQGAFCKVCRKRGKPLQRSGGAWITKPFSNWKKAIEKMQAHARSEVHIQSCQSELTAAAALRGGSIVEQLQQVGQQEKVKNRVAIKALIRCTHFLARRHIPHTTNFDELVDLVVSCGGQDLKQFVERSGRNATYTSKDSVVEFIEALGQWVEESLLKRVHQAPFFSLMADECTDITTVEELSIFCRWVEDGIPVEHFIDIVPLKKADAQTIYSTLVECLKAKSIQLTKLVGMGFDGAATFSGKRNGVQSLLKKNSPHAIFVHCHCHLLQLACVQAANNTSGIKHVYTTLMTLWKFFHYSPKRTETLKEIQRVLDQPEFKVIKPSDTRWLAHERCVKAVKENYSSIVLALNNIYEESHEPEALGISKALCQKSSILAIHMLDYILPQVAKLSKTLQTEKLDLTIISALVDATLLSVDDALEPAANWVLNFLDLQGDLQEATNTLINTADIASFQGSVANHFVADLKSNISSRFASQDIVSAFGILNPCKLPKSDSPSLTTYGENSIKLLADHYGTEMPAETVQGDEYTKQPVIPTSPEIHTEWKTFRNYMARKPEEDMKAQLKELASNKMLVTMFPNLSTLANVVLTIPVSTASVERSFSQMKLIKTRLRNRLGERSLSSLMKIAVESPDKLSDNELEEVVDIWNRKPRKIVV